jgi:hypothetical protein
MLFDLTFPCYLTTFSGKKCLSGKVVCAFFGPAYRSSPVCASFVPLIEVLLYWKRVQGYLQGDLTDEQLPLVVLVAGTAFLTPGTACVLCQGGWGMHAQEGSVPIPCGETHALQLGILCTHLSATA